MKKILLDESLNPYRANLHCHSTISDGKKTPEELKAILQTRVEKLNVQIKEAAASGQSTAILE